MTNIPKQLLVPPSGFPDLGPGEAIALNRMLDVIRRHYELAGFVPIETPLVERTDILFAKAEGEIKTQVYGLRLMNPASDAKDDSKDLALRFDQTVPLARFVAGNHGKLSFPFRRYVIGPVFRGERPKDGRYRQFIQADIDAIGDGDLDLLNDAEMVAVIAGIFSELAIGDFTVRIGNRKVLQGLLHSIGLTSDEAAAKALAAVDRLAKVGFTKVQQTLMDLGASEDAVQDLLRLISTERSTDETLDDLRSRNFNSVFKEGVEEICAVVEAVRGLGVPEHRFRVDISIARGLDYYTGTVYETRFDQYPDLGSIASGGRYEDLAGSMVGRKLPGVGISIGVTRLLLRLIKAGLVSAQTTTVAPVLVTVATDAPEYRAKFLSFAAMLRTAGIGAEVYLARGRSLGKQMQFANKRGFTIVIIAREEQLQSQTMSVRNLKTGEQKDDVAESELVTTVRSLL